MSIQSEYTRLVTKYLEGGMTGSEQYIFEDQLTSDPLLKTEFEHQNEIVNGLKEFRKTQLKTRLNNLTVGPGIIGVLSQSVSMKTLSYVVTSILIGAGSYYYFNSPRKPKAVNLSYVESRLDFLLPEIDYSNNAVDLSYKYNQNTDLTEWIIEEETKKNGEAEEQTNKISLIDFSVPEVHDDVSTDDPPEPEQILEKAVARSESFVAAGEFSKVDIENVVNNRYKFHYKLDNNKLYLYGKFEASPYEIIEINSFQSKKLFFYYNRNYFKLNQNVNDISPLLKIENPEIITELNILKKRN
jgi:hypothetical protein